MPVRALGLLVLELRDHVLVMEDGPRDQMREVRHEQRVMRQRIGRDLAAISVDQKRDLGEGVEGDADRQQDVERDIRAEQRVDVLRDEAGIFEDAEHEEIADDAERECGLSLRVRELRHDEKMADAVVEGDREQQKGDELPAADCVEGDRSQRQPDHRSQIAAPAEPEIAGEHDRQEQQDERIGIEQHRAGPAAGYCPSKHTRGRSTTRQHRRSCWQSAESERYKGGTRRAAFSSPSPRSYGERVGVSGSLHR
ncbi:hypothetical protein ABH994_007648 [Bradyrhizobium yuanmingense]